MDIWYMYIHLHVSYHVTSSVYCILAGSLFIPFFSAACARLILWKISPDWNSANLVTRLRRGAKIGMYPLKGKVICKISANVSHHDDTMANHGWRDTRTGYELLCCILDVSAMSVCQLHIGLASFSSCRYLLGMQILTLTRERKLELEILVYIPRFS